MAVYDKIQALLKEKGVTQSDLEKSLGFGKGTISKWKKSSPSTDKLMLVAEFFNASLDWLMDHAASSYSSTDRISEDESYYLDDEARDMAQFLYDNPEYRVLFDATRKVKKEDIEFVKQMIDRIKGGN